jgi:hypothetical protein
VLKSAQDRSRRGQAGGEIGSIDREVADTGPLAFANR